MKDAKDYLGSYKGSFQTCMNEAIPNFHIILPILIADPDCFLDEERAEPHWRRNFIRSFFPHIEAMAYASELFCLLAYEQCKKGSDADLSSLSRKTKEYLDTGRYEDAADRFKNTIQCAYELLALGSPPGFGNQGWEAVQRAIERRDGFMHPKSVSDLEITDQE